MSKVWVKDANNGLGSGARVQRNYYAWLVSMALTNGSGECPTCDARLDMSGNAAHVDRLTFTGKDADGNAHYIAGDILYVCAACNLQRAERQAVGGDWARIAELREAVALASEAVEVPTIAAARAWWAGRGKGPERSPKWD